MYRWHTYMYSIGVCKRNKRRARLNQAKSGRVLDRDIQFLFEYSLRRVFGQQQSIETSMRCRHPLISSPILLDDKIETFKTADGASIVTRYKPK
mmetsp:Transcript_25552/g.64089  ORF Transcript_25552/g.64089 Transcript_25552/m.64089 type:complete len:94 (-) Transcript_25552:3068-3349(-)